METKKLIDYDPNNITEDVLDLMTQHCQRTSFSIFQSTKNRINAISLQYSIHPIFVIHHGLALLEEAAGFDTGNIMIKNAEFIKQINEFRDILRQHKRRY